MNAGSKRASPSKFAKGKEKQVTKNDRTDDSLGPNKDNKEPEEEDAPPPQKKRGRPRSNILKAAALWMKQK
jgi:hypothetical protein